MCYGHLQQHMSSSRDSRQDWVGKITSYEHGKGADKGNMYSACTLLDYSKHLD
jgi:hypothetical protein